MRLHRGFTLIEILVVLVIIGIIVTLAAVQFGRNDTDTLQREAERLSLLLETARDEAIAAGSVLGFAPEAHGYRFWLQAGDGQWQPLADNEVLRPRELPDTVRIDALRINLQAAAEGQKLVFAPSGVNAPFSLTLRTGEASRVLSADALGRLTIGNPASQPVATP